jgi:hypothetical protein
MSQWVFEELRGAAVRRDPNEAELFKTEQASEGEYAGNDALVREILQNSVDARHGAGPVKVRLAVHEPGDAPDRDRLAHYFQRLREPLAQRQISFDRHGCPRLPCRSRHPCCFSLAAETDVPHTPLNSVSINFTKLRG